MNVTLYNSTGEKLEEKAVASGLSDVKISSVLLHEVVIAYLANQRKGNACAKTKAEVSGGGAKPWNQKHTGRARAGSNRSPLFRKGGVVFGPKPRSYRQYLPKKKLQAALGMAVKSKIEGNELILLKDLKIEDCKTKKLQQILHKLNVKKENVLLVVKEAEKNLRLASRNIENLELIPVNFLNAYKVLWARKVIFVEDAFNQFTNKN
ncbi:MAG: 50S ribosomal protein L4 [Elusimicrobia bacterium]|nr:50S ribosomal protein L4 [Elusimicrobiota bacterium]